MLANNSSAGLGIAASADSYTARQASQAGSGAQNTVQRARNSDQISGGYDDGTSTPAILEEMTQPQPLRREARHLFQPRVTKLASSNHGDSSGLDSKLNPRSAAIVDADAGEPADSRQSLRLISAACTTELDASASIASAAGATGTLPTAYSQLSLRSLQRVSVSSTASSTGQIDADRSPMGVPETICEQLPSTPLVQQNTRNIHDVARLVSQLFGSQPGHGFSFGTGAPASNAAPQKRLKLQSCWPASWRKKMTGMPTCPPQLSKAEAAKIMHAAVLSQGGATISDVVLDLGKSGCLVLQGTSRTELRNVHIEGGIVLCHGPQCHLSITDCSFKACKLLIAEGATVNIARSSIQEHLSVNAAAFVVSGRNTTVHVSDTHVSVGRGFIVQDRATLSGTDVRVTGTNGALVTASGTGTQLTLERSNTEFMRDKSNLAVAASAGKLFRGVAAVSCDGAQMTLRDCVLREFFRGVHALRHGKVALEGCVVEASRSDGEGVYAQMGSVSMHDTKVLGCGEYGVCVSGGGATTTAHLFAEGCTVEGSSKTVAVAKDEWSTAEVRRCVLNGEKVTSAW